MLSTLSLSRHNSPVAVYHLGAVTALLTNPIGESRSGPRLPTHPQHTVVSGVRPVDLLSFPYH
jgi:hypothetical protein